MTYKVSFIHSKYKLNFLATSEYIYIVLLIPCSLPRCACDDLCWVWVSDDISSSIWLWKYWIQLALGLLCNPVVHPYIWTAEFHWTN